MCRDNAINREGSGVLFYVVGRGCGQNVEDQVHCICCRNTRQAGQLQQDTRCIKDLMGYLQGFMQTYAFLRTTVPTARQRYRVRGKRLAEYSARLNLVRYLQYPCPKS